ncbi:MAG: phage BR0599 family protein, partial [Sphingomicrobium sp.]
GDPGCGVDMAGRSLRARVTAVAAHQITVDEPADDRFRFGQIRILGGSANGERRTILSVEGQQLALRTAPSSAVAIGTPLEIIEGCDKRLETCSARFGNAANFRAEPHLPGNDLLTRYPGA